MLELLKKLILDGQESALTTGVPRRSALAPVPGKATVCIGARRSGKSTLMLQLMERLVRAGTARENVAHLNFFDDRLHTLRGQDLGLVADAYYGLYPAKKGLEKVHFFFDELQTLHGWEPFVERLLRTEKCEVYITGSSAALLSREIATQMRGRALSWELFPFSFREYCDWAGLDAGGHLSTRRALLVQQAFDGYWERGGFPEVIALDPALRTRIHQEYFNGMVLRDVVDRHDVSHPRAVSDLAHRLVDSVASLYSINKLTGYLKALGHRVAKTAVADYLAWFEDAFSLFSVLLFDASLARAHVNPKKVYCVDHALARSVSSGVLVNSGHLLENLVFVALRRRTPSVWYYRTRAGREVDFVVRMPDKLLRLVQVCESLVDPATRRREVSAVREAMAELGLADATLVTRSATESIEVETGRIDVVPAWQFLLDQE